MDHLKHPRVLIAVAVAAMALAAGAAALALGSAGSADDAFTIELGDGAIGLEAPTVAAGPRLVEVANVGTEEHEVVVVRTDRPVDGIPVGLHGVSPSLAGEVVIGEDHAALKHRHPAARILGLLPGQSRSYQVELDPGRYVVICQADNHYLEGERATLQVR